MERMEVRKEGCKLFDVVCRGYPIIYIATPSSTFGKTSCSSTFLEHERFSLQTHGFYVFGQ